MSVDKKKKSVQFRNHKPFFIRHLQHSLASSRHAGRKWMKKAGGFSLFFFSTTFWLCDTKHYTKHWPYLHSYWCRREKKSAAAVVPPLFFPPPPLNVLHLLWSPKMNQLHVGVAEQCRTLLDTASVIQLKLFYSSNVKEISLNVFRPRLNAQCT